MKINQWMNHRRHFICSTFILLIHISYARAEVVRMEVESRKSYADGESFGNAGAYEHLTGRLYMEADPEDPANARIIDLKLAPRNDRGQVEFNSRFDLIKPVDPRKGNRRIVYGVNNRGNKLLLKGFNNSVGGSQPEAGNGFLMREGYSILWCGWNGDVLPGGNRLQIKLPVALEDGQPITGQIYAEFCVDKKVYSQPLCWGQTDVYPAIDTDNTSATLTMRANRDQPAQEIPSHKWSFATLNSKKQVLPSTKSLYIKDGFRPGWLYELVYTARDPRVTGLGFAAVRDCVSFFRFADSDINGGVNPLAKTIDYAYIFGVSQSSRFIHHFLCEAFNTDERGRKVFDGAFAHVGGAGRGMFNCRFAQTTRHTTQHEENLFPTDVFPFNSVKQSDPVTGETGDAFATLRNRGHLPKLFYTNTSAEYWGRAASLLHTDVQGTEDATLDPNVRIYFIAGSQHWLSGKRYGKSPMNKLDYRPVLRALLVALDRWAANGVEPPASRYPRIDDGTLVTLETWKEQFPRIPNIELPHTYSTPYRLDPGQRWATQGIADNTPPRVGEAFRPLLPAVDADGNELAGIRLPAISVPMRTYTGWNLRKASAGAENMLVSHLGSQFEFADDKSSREASGDPRLSIQERYPSTEDYVELVKEAAQTLVEQGFLMQDDFNLIIKSTALKKLPASHAATK